MLKKENLTLGIALVALFATTFSAFSPKPIEPPVITDGNEEYVRINLAPVAEISAPIAKKVDGVTQSYDVNSDGTVKFN